MRHIIHFLILISLTFSLAYTAAAQSHPCEQGKQDLETAIHLYESQERPDYPRIIDLMKNAMRLCPNWSDPPKYLGNIMESQEKYHEAIDYYLKAIEIDDNDYEAKLYLGDAYSAIGQDVHALRYYFKGTRMIESDNKLRANKEAMKILPEYQQKRLALKRKMKNFKSESDLTPHLNIKEGKKIGAVPKVDLSVEFATDRAIIIDDWKAQLDEVADLLKKDSMKPYKLIVQGHTDSRGEESHNRSLSVRRARAVADYLYSKGVKPSSIFLVEGKGETQPFKREEGETEGAWHQRNRRVVFISCEQDDSREDCMEKAGAQ